MEIAPDFTEADWKKLQFHGKRDWIRAIAAFRKRLHARFIRPARSLLRQKRSGFAVLALDCLLIETLQQFLEGVAETPYKQQERYFKSFLRSKYFGLCFSEDEACLFYTTIRNGILHQAEVKASSLVRRDGPIVKLSSDGKGVVVNPCHFHNQLEQAFDAYVADLRDGSNAALRQSFRKKMDYVAQVASNP